LIDLSWHGKMNVNQEISDFEGFSKRVFTL